jgi:hypothetical protein
MHVRLHAPHPHPGVQKLKMRQIRPTQTTVQGQSCPVRVPTTTPTLGSPLGVYVGA